MERRKKQERRSPAAGGPFNDLGTPTPVRAAEEAVVSHGIYAERLPVAGMTVGEIRARFADRFDIPPGALAILSGQIVTDDIAVGPGELLTFSHRSGEKGGAAA